MNPKKSSPRALVCGSLAGAAMSMIAFAAPSSADPNANPIPEFNSTNWVPRLCGRTQVVEQLTGRLGANRTQDTNVLGTDLGIMWDNGSGQVLTAFGDTVGFDLRNPIASSPSAWRSNILFRSADRDLSDGMTFDSTPLDSFGQSKELVPSLKIPFTEISRIPTAGIAVDGTQYLSLMSIRNWGPAGFWETNYSRLAFSTDNGENWTIAPETTRPSEGGNRNFQMSAFVRQAGFVYQYGTPPGRGGLVHVARVPESQILDLGAYEYWDGSAWVKADATAARPIMPYGVGEISVQWSDFLSQFVMLTTDQHDSVVMRHSPTVIGPWSEPEIVVDARELPGTYGAYIHPWSSGPELYFLATVHDRYNVLLLHTTLDSAPQSEHTHLIGATR